VSWSLEEATGSAATFHARELPAPASRQVWLHHVDRPALVLGSTQPDGVADADACARGGVEVVRRRSGGGAVLLVPGEALWIDLLVPRQDPLWDDDVGRAAHWVGRAWGRAIAAAGIGDLSIHEHGLDRTPWSDLVCFAGTGPGEVVRRGAKLVGISQRRTRSVARFQCVALRSWEPEPLLGLLSLRDVDRDRAARELAAVAAGVPVDELAELLPANLPG
jgi:lipoate---protein ligase